MRLIGRPIFNIAAEGMIYDGRRDAIIGVMTDVTQILSQIESGDPSAAEQLLPLVYDELRKLAAAQAGPGEAGADACRPRRWCMRRIFGWSVDGERPAVE